MKKLGMAVLAFALVTISAHAQTLAGRVTGAGDGDVEVLFASRPDACGDGRHFVHGVFGDNGWIGDGVDGRNGSWGAFGRCERGPVRVRITVESGRVAYVRSYLGPVPPPESGVRRLDAVPVAEAVRLLTGIARADDGRVARDALLPIVLADSTTPWPLFLELARSADRSRSLRRQASFWLGRGAAAKLGISGMDDDDDDVRRSAVFALSQQPRDVSVPALLTIARSDRLRPSVRAQALFWLGQSDDPRALDLFERVLK